MTILWCALPAPSLAANAELEGWIRYLDSQLPGEAAGYQTRQIGEVARAANAVDEWSAYAAAQMDGTPAASLDVARQLLSAKARVERMFDQALQRRSQFAGLDKSIQRDAIRGYLRVTSTLIDLSGRLRYLLSDVLHAVASVTDDVAQRQQLLGLLGEFRSSIGATAVSTWLADSPSPTLAPRLGARRFGRRQAEAADDGQQAVQLSVLRLIAASGEGWLLPRVAEFLRSNQRPAECVLTAAETIRSVGLPQDVRPGTPAGVPAPAITAAQLHDRLAQLDGSRLSGTQAGRRAELMSWLDARRHTGLAEDSYPLGTFQVQPGDWLLMRNPSPYNLFTDLSPGLFTHVGVVTTEQGADGIRRMVLVDLQEKGRMSAINIEIFVQRSLNYVFLRHPDPTVARQMAEAARSVIGSETEFDLNFRTERVLELAHQPLAGRKIRTYCAGLLLLCALQTSADRHDFFPVVEYAAGGLTVENLALLGMSFGKDFMSPTGALYSTRLLLVGRREPMYEPRRQIEEAVYDHFASGLVDEKLSPAPQLFDSLRYKVAEAARHSPVLAQALARASGINADADLLAAARAAAVLETLDDIAVRTSAEFDRARDAVRRDMSDTQSLPQAEAATVARLRQQHAQLAQQWQADQLSPRELRIKLVDYYIAQGRREIDRQFFGRKATGQQPDNKQPAQGDPAADKPVADKPVADKPAADKQAR